MLLGSSLSLDLGGLGLGDLSGLLSLSLGSELLGSNANETKAAFEGKTVTVDVKVGDEGILFGSVTAALIADAIKAQLGMDIDRKRVELGKPIKVAGAHTVAISLYREIKAEVVVLVGVTAEELAAEAETEETAEVAEAETAEVETEAAAE